MTKSASGKFSLIVPAFTWIQQEQTNRLHYGFDLVIENPDTGVWLRARVGPRSPRGMDGALDEEVIFAKMLIDFRPENVEAEVSLDSYRGSAIFCGGLRWHKTRPACSLIFVVLHGHETVRFHSLVQTRSEAKIETMLEEIASLLSTWQFHESAGG